MALIVITVKDGDQDGSLDVQAVAEPFIPTEEDAELTPAQVAAQLMIGALAAVIEANEEALEGDSDLTEPMA